MTMWIVACMLLGSWIGLTKHENGIIALPFGWLSARTMQLVVLHLGHIPKKTSNGQSKAAQVTSMLVFFAVYMRTFGFESHLIAILLLVEGARLAWEWYHSQSGVEEDVNDVCSTLISEESHLGGV